MYGLCMPGAPIVCDDGLACTTDTCDEASDACVAIPAPCNHDGVCDVPCETPANCLDDCPECACKVDLDEDGSITLNDIIGALECADGTPPPEGIDCVDADLNCDGAIDDCDVGVVWCQWAAGPGGEDCCDLSIPCGACCNSDSAFAPCTITSESFCTGSPFFTDGYYAGDGSTCDGGACTPVCTVDAECDDADVCTTDTCLPSGFCVHGDAPNGTPCPDDLFCNGEETCQGGVCLSLAPVDCDDGIGCTTDVCDVGLDECVSTPSACNDDGTCDYPCETATNCPGDCTGCACKVDLDGSGVVNLTDILGVLECADGGTPPAGVSCDDADLNCDGIVSYCDAGVVYCQFASDPQGTDCCDTPIPCGACCGTNSPFAPCSYVTEQFCNGALISEGYYVGDGVACTPDACDPVCTFDEDCDDGNVCTIDTCTARGFCAYENAPNGTSCPDDLFCNGEETCQGGVCLSLAPVDCDDGIGCTTDVCDVGLDECVSTPSACNDDGTCDYPCETATNCPGDCTGCACKVDLDGSGVVNLTDILGVLECADGGTPPAGVSCDDADLNCDGIVSYCDVGVAYCQFASDPQGTDCCDTPIPCGACCGTNSPFAPCSYVTEQFCNGALISEGVLRGRWRRLHAGRM